MCKKAVSWILAVLMVFGCVSATAETAKQEKVYVTACADGTVTSVTDSIRLENPDGLDTLEDRTMLAGIENMGGKEVFSLDGEVLTWQAGPGPGRNDHAGRGDGLRRGTEGPGRRSRPEGQLPLGGRRPGAGCNGNAASGKRCFRPEGGKRVRGQ